MDTRSKVTLSCAAVMLLLLVGGITAFVIFVNSFATDPIKGWLEDPYTPAPSPTVSVSPESSATAKTSTEKPEHP
jgi:hypothetical protein